MIKFLIKLTVVLAAIVLIGGSVDWILSGRALEGQWQFVPPNVSEEAVQAILDQAEKKAEDKKAEKAPKRQPPGGRLLKSLGRDLRSALTKVSNAVLSEMSKEVRLKVSDGGYAIQGSLGSIAAIAAYRASGGPMVALEGCTTGTFFAAFPLAKITCGDGSGRSMWFLMTGWPSEEFSLFPLPNNNAEIKDKLEQIMAEGSTDPKRLKALTELLTIRFKRTAAVSGQ